MTIQTNTNNRKAMVAAIAQHVGQVQQYQAAPSFSYTIGSITVAQDGSITGSDEDLRALLPFLMEKGYIDEDAQDVPVDGLTDEAASTENVEPDSQLSIQELCDYSDADAQNDSARDETKNNPSPIQEPVQEKPGAASNKQGTENDTDDEPQVNDSQSAAEQPAIDSAIITLGNVDLTPQAATNLLFSLYTEQYLLNRAFGEDVLSISDQLVARIQEHPTSTMDEFLSITGKATENGELRGADFGAGTFRMTFPADAAEPETRNMYVQLMHQLIRFAITVTRVTPKLLKPENEKYYMHNWLTRLGCGGLDFKALRTRMLSGLDGCCAFPDEERAQRHKDRYKEIRRIARQSSKSSKGSKSSQNNESGEDSQCTENRGNVKSIEHEEARDAEEASDFEEFIKELEAI